MEQYQGTLNHKRKIGITDILEITIFCYSRGLAERGQEEEQENEQN